MSKVIIIGAGGVASVAAYKCVENHETFKEISRSLGMLNDDSTALMYRSKCGRNASGCNKKSMDYKGRWITFC